MGSHTDYNGLPVVAMTIDREVRMAFRPREDGKVVVRDVNPEFAEGEFEVSDEIPRAEIGDWNNYVRAAVQGIVEAEFSVPAGGQWRGFDGMISSDVPSGGVSSSSALVVAASLAFLGANGFADEDVDKKALASLLARAERYVGTEGGGMDQASSLLCEQGAALRIDFFPLRVKASKLPDDLVWILINSRTKAIKTAAARANYNRRPVECRIAAAILAKEWKVKHSHERPVRLADIVMNFPVGPLDKIVDNAIGILGEEGWTDKAIAERLEIRVDELSESLCKLQSGEILAQPEDGFQLGRRARHVFREAQRVETLSETLPISAPDEIGKLINGSFESGRGDYRISREELNELQSIAIGSGAAGCRIAGAGFGGFMIAAVPRDKEQTFKENVAEEYYNTYLGGLKSEQSPPGDPSPAEMFACRPIAGAGIIRLPQAT